MRCALGRVGGVVMFGIHNAKAGNQRFIICEWVVQRDFLIFVSVNRFGLLGVQSEQLRIRIF